MKIFHTALIWPDIACCWPMLEVSPFCALDTKRNELVNSTTAVSRLA